MFIPIPIPIHLPSVRERSRSDAEITEAINAHMREIRYEGIKWRILSDEEAERERALNEDTTV